MCFVKTHAPRAFSVNSPVAARSIQQQQLGRYSSSKIASRSFFANLTQGLAKLSAPSAALRKPGPGCALHKSAANRTSSRKICYYSIGFHSQRPPNDSPVTLTTNHYNINQSNVTMNLDSNKTSDVTFATVPRFVRTVYDMLQNEDQRIISWSADGSHFQVYDVPRLETEVLHKYFKHGKFSSFQRQLNNFGFHKWTKTRASVATFSHEVLVRCHPSQLAVLVGQMKLKQKAVAVMTSAPVKPTTSMKRPRNLLGYTTEITTLTKKHKMSPRDVCAIDELSDVGFASFVDLPWLMEDDSCGFNDDLLLGVVDSVDLAELDWDAFAASLDFCNGDNDNNSNSHSSTIAFDADMDLCFDVHSDASIAVLTEDDLCADLGGLDTIPSLTDCETELVLGSSSFRYQR
ncbi:HSF-type DNA-binding [Phytophthora infestans]|uniref:HSF-type DNA-binding n=1 Tax=Phytophthora infestans TaxID=4787 RepID=A0A8S9UHS1_PHYIN|nr:HSF-type DNA-binding [Phytophthora infestans]